MNRNRHKASETRLDYMLDDRDMRKISLTIFDAMVRKSNQRLKEIEDALIYTLCIGNV